MIVPLTTDLATLATGRKSSLFQPDLEACHEQLRSRIEGSRLLVIGGCGSIGAATVRTVLGFNPAAVHVADQNENGLAELVRDLRSQFTPAQMGDFRTLPVEFGSPVMERFIRCEAPYDHVLNFAALKHVRSEKDTYSTLQMLDTNVLKPARLLRWLVERGGVKRYFCVSTDKAANPVNLMGATKRLMEHVIFSEEVMGHSGLMVSSARFANVAFSDGSLLQSWLARLSKGQPLAVPRATRRFFVSLEEAGQICALAAFISADSCLLVPRLDPDADLHDLAEIAQRVMRHLGYEPSLFEDEQAAREAAARGASREAYPLLLTALDTSGEKPFEEFVGNGEESQEIGLKNLLSVRHVPAAPGVLKTWLENMSQIMAATRQSVSRQQLAEEIGRVLPEFHHIASAKSLDQRL